MDVEAHQRGETLYAPDENARLYPPTLSEAPRASSPTRRVPPSSGRRTSTRRGKASNQRPDALVRSRAKLDYVSALAGAGRRDRRPAAAAPARGRAPSRGAGDPPRRRQPRDSRAGHHPGRRPVLAAVPRAARGRGVERPDVPDDGNGRGRPDARGRHRLPPHGAARRPRPPATAPPHGGGAAGRVAGGRPVSRVRPKPQPVHRAMHASPTYRSTRRRSGAVVCAYVEASAEWVGCSGGTSSNHV